MRIKIFSLTAAAMLSSVLFVNNNASAAGSLASFCARQNSECLRGCPGIKKLFPGQTPEGCRQVCGERNNSCQASGCYTWKSRPTACFDQGKVQR
jgi:hypothetical protein